MMEREVEEGAAGACWCVLVRAGVWHPTLTVWCRLTAVTFFMQSLIICEVKKLVSPFFSTVIFR